MVNLNSVTMKGLLSESLSIICKALDEYQVQYLLVGGTAVLMNGYSRLSTTSTGETTEKPDIGIWYNPTYENYFNLLKVFEELGRDIDDFLSEQSPNPRKSFFKFEFEDFTFDALPSIKAEIKFFEAYQRRETAELEGTKIHYLSYLDLIADKQVIGRKKDFDDITQLKKIRGEE